MTQLIIADLDGTLLTRWSPDDYTPYPGPALSWVQEASCPVVILTNQGGLALRWAGLPWARRYPGLKAILRRIRAGLEWSGAVLALAAANHRKQYRTARGRLLAALGKFLPPIPVTPDGIFISFDAQFRKPAPGGISWLCRRMNVSPGECIFVGDSTDDRGAAQAAGVKFIPV